MEQQVTTRCPGEVVEVYRQARPREVVEVYTRPLPGRLAPAPAAQGLPVQKKRRKLGLAVFLILLVLAVLLALAARFWPWREEEEGDWQEALEELTEEVSIPTYPTGQGASLPLEREPREAITAQEVYRQVNPSVVTVMVRLEEGKDYGRMSVGTGVIFTEDGYIITNYHVVEGGRECSVALDTGRTYQAFYVAGDQENDLAVLKVDETGLPAARFLDSDSLQVGDKVYAIGNPLGVELRGTLTDGIVSAINRDVDVDGRTMTLIQTNAALNSGNSGGPLINECGQVVGINVVKMMSQYESVEGLGFAIPTASMERIVRDLLTFGQVQPEPSLGLLVAQLGTRLDGELWGIQVMGVTEGSAAEQAGVLKGDYVVRSGGEEITSSRALLRVRSRYYLGDELPITLWRDGELLEVTLRLEQAATD